MKFESISTSEKIEQNLKKICESVLDSFILILCIDKFPEITTTNIPEDYNDYLQQISCSINSNDSKLLKCISNISDTDFQDIKNEYLNACGSCLAHEIRKNYDSLEQTWFKPLEDEYVSTSSYQNCVLTKESITLISEFYYDLFSNVTFIIFKVNGYFKTKDK